MRGMIINAKTSRENPRSYALWSDGREVGWLRAGAIGFSSLPHSLGARHAAQLAARTLADWYRIRWRQSTPVAWVDDVAPELQVTVNGIVVGRLFTGAGRPADGDASGFELRIPDGIWIATGVELAQRIYSALHEVAPVIDLVASSVAAEPQPA